MTSYLSVLMLSEDKLLEKGNIFMSFFKTVNQNSSMWFWNDTKGLEYSMFSRRAGIVPAGSGLKATLRQGDTLLQTSDPIVIWEIQEMQQRYGIWAKQNSERGAEDSKAQISELRHKSCQ